MENNCLWVNTQGNTHSDYFGKCCHSWKGFGETNIKCLLRSSHCAGQLRIISPEIVKQNYWEFPKATQETFKDDMKIRMGIFYK